MKITMVYEHSLRAWLDGKRLIANRGGTRSGKTYSLVCLLVSIAKEGKKRTIDIVSESLPHLKRGAMNDIEDILTNEGMVEDVHYTHNRSDHTYTFGKGTSVRFFSADDWGKVKGSRRDILFINEANRIPYETYRQLAVRTTECIFIDWNPDTEFWFEIKSLNTKDTTKEIVSTYKDNPFLSDVQIEEIESNKGDEAWWKVYGLGEVGRPQGVIYDRWQQVNDIHEGATLVARGLDFGFTVDPTAMVDVYKYDGKLWLDEVCYRHGMTNDKIAAELKGFRGRTVADSAELKSITEIYNYGIRYIEPAKKGADSVRAGIDVLRRYEMMVTKRSLNLIYELRNYKWKENRLTGEIMNEPVDKFNHCFVGETMITTMYGDVRIDSIKEGDYVLTSDGWHKVNRFFDNGVKEVFEYQIFFSNFIVKITCTEDHLFKTDKGWKKISEIKESDVLFVMAKSKSSMVRSITNIKENDISQEEAIDYTEMCGSFIMEKYLKGIMSIIKIKIHAIILLIILNLSSHQSILANMYKSILKMKNSWKKHVRGWQMQIKQLVNGTVQKKGENGIESMVLTLQKQRPIKNLCALFVESHLNQKKVIQNSAQTIVSQNTGEIADLIMKNEYANCAEEHLSSTSIQKRNFVQKRAVMKICRESKGERNVYDFEVDSVHEYIANGVVVHNCLDAVRYVALNHLAERPKTARPKGKLPQTC